MENARIDVTQVTYQAFLDDENIRRRFDQQARDERAIAAHRLLVEPIAELLRRFVMLRISDRRMMISPQRRTDMMKRRLALPALCVAACFAATAALAQSGHKMTKPEELKWDDVPSLPKGAKIAVIEGPMSQAVPFTVRLKFPANYSIPPHFHPAVERVTVLSGEFHMGVGEKLDKGKLHALKPGGMMILEATTPHFAWAKAETVVQLHGTGPWGVTYVNPTDDPRKK